jgi:hypothetical protein
MPNEEKLVISVVFTHFGILENPSGPMIFSQMIFHQQSLKSETHSLKNKTNHQKIFEFIF